VPTSKRKPTLRFLQIMHGIDEAVEVAAETIKLPHHEGIPFPESLQVDPRSVIARRSLPAFAHPPKQLTLPTSRKESGGGSFIDKHRSGGSCHRSGQCPSRDRILESLPVEEDGWRARRRANKPSRKDLKYLRFVFESFSVNG
jgi:hypothetical protein